MLSSALSYFFNQLYIKILIIIVTCIKRKQRLSNILYDELVKKREKCSDKKRIEYKKKE